MSKNNLTFDYLPQAVSNLVEKVELIERILLQNLNESGSDPNKLLNVKQAAKFLNLAVATIYTKTSNHEIPFMKRGKKLYFAQEDLINYLKEGRKKTNEEIQEEAEAYLTSKKGGVS